MQDSFSHVITIYNRTVQDGGEVWRRTVISGVEVADRQGEAIRHSGAASSSARRVGPVSVGEMTVLIPKGVQTGYLSPISWRMAEDRAGHWTLQAGDIIVPELCTHEVQTSISELMEGCDRVAVISTVTSFGGNGDMCHREVTAR